MKSLIMICMVLGSFAGGYVPVLWGGDVFSMTSILLTAVGGLIGIWAGYKIALRIGL